jgi:hypothetical protein
MKIELRFGHKGPASLLTEERSTLNADRGIGFQPMSNWLLG